ncbi:MAG: FAD-dependent oxidoreductase [Paracoccaceae bacterium]
MTRYKYEKFDYVSPPGLIAPEPRHQVVIAGAGPIGLSMAIDLATRGVPSVVLDDNDVVSVGSRAICWAKRSLEIFDRLGVGERMLEKGVTWKVGRLFHRSEEIYNFDLLPEDGHKYPAFINLQQYYVEQYLVERAQEFPELVDLRFRNEVVDHADHGDHVALSIATPEGEYALETAYFLACDGAASPTRARMGLSFEGQTFDEHFLIADIEMEQSPFGTQTPERWFWFEPDFHPGQSALLHKQPDDIYRIDLQLGPDADPAEEAKEENALPRIRAIVGDTPFKLDWLSVYKFRCAMLDRFVHNRMIFAGDSAHVVSPFGARGGNGGIQDVDNLGWKLAAVLDGSAPQGLLETYDQERRHAARENIRHSSRATNFMTPKTPIEQLFRNEVLRLSHDLPFARRLLNSGRLSQPCSLVGQALQTEGENAPLKPGQPIVDAPLEGADGTVWLIELVQGRFTLVGFGDMTLPKIDGVTSFSVGVSGYADPTGLATHRYGRGWCYLFRPDAHVAAAFRPPNDSTILAAVSRALGGDLEPKRKPVS